jgi:hypothetical protein
MERYEYKQFTIETTGVFTTKVTQEFIDRLNELGDDGWELVQALPLAQPYGKTGPVLFILKRPKKGS